MAMSWMMMLMMMLTTQGSVNDALDVLDSKAYWQPAKVEMTVDSIAAQLDAKVEGETAQAASVRKLMAIRALGELKDKAALAKLKPLLDDKSPFVADYAKRAIAEIEGKPCVRAEATKEQLSSDLALLPSGCGVVAQMRVMPGAPVSWDKFAELMKGMAPANDGEAPDADEMRREIAKGIGGFLAQVGNFRLEALTLGVAGEIGPRKVFAVVVARGLCDIDAVRGVVKESARQGVNTIDGTDVYRQNRGAAVLCPSSDRLIFILGEPDETMDVVVKQIAAVLKGGKGGLETDADMKDLVNSVDRTKRLWVAVKMTDSYRQVEILAPFDTLTLVVGDKEGVTSFTLVARAQDKDKVAAAVKMFEDGRQEGLQAMKKEGAPETMKPFLARVSDFLESIKVVQDGAQATVTASFKGDASSTMLLPMLMFSRASRVEAPRAVAVEPKPDAEPKR